jgi:hypothetical protein
VLTLLCRGRPLQAIVAAFGFDERSMAQWQAGAGEPCQKVMRSCFATSLKVSTLEPKGTLMEVPIGY